MEMDELVCKLRSFALTFNCGKRRNSAGLSVRTSFRVQRPFSNSSKHVCMFYACPWLRWPMKDSSVLVDVWDESTAPPPAAVTWGTSSGPPPDLLRTSSGPPQGPPSLPSWPTIWAAPPSGLLWNIQMCADNTREVFTRLPSASCRSSRDPEEPTQPGKKQTQKVPLRFGLKGRRRWGRW